MSETPMFIPKVCRVGWQERSDTYQNRLAYIIYYDEKGKLRKEGSWEGWRSKKIEPQNVDNTPFNGFVLNKGIKRGGWDHFSQTVEKVRVFDPRCGGIEFEITLNNLIFILMHDDCTKRELTGSYVYAWSGSDLVLLPVSSENYTESARVTELKDTKVGIKELVPGVMALTKNGDSMLYLGRYEVSQMEGHYVKSPGARYNDKYVKEVVTTKGHLFSVVKEAKGYSHYGKRFEVKKTKFVLMQGLVKLSRISDTTPSQDLAKLTNLFLSSKYSTRKIVSVSESPIDVAETIATFPETGTYNTGYGLKMDIIVLDKDSVYHSLQIHPEYSYDYSNPAAYKLQEHVSVRSNTSYRVVDGLVELVDCPWSYNSKIRVKDVPTLNLVSVNLTLANGTVLSLNDYVNG